MKMLTFCSVLRKSNLHQSVNFHSILFVPFNVCIEAIIQGLLCNGLLLLVSAQAKPQ